MSTVELVLHPVRMRILMALANHQATTGQLAKVMPDVPQATLYRHLRTLLDGGLIEVAAENPVRGTLEKVYTLGKEGGNLSVEALANLSAADHMRLFTGFIAALLSEFSLYIESSPQIDFVADGVGYRRVVIHLNDEEFIRMATDLNRALAPYLTNQPTVDRRRRILSTIVMPDATTDESEAQ